MKILAILSVFFISTAAQAEPVFRIEFNRDYKQVSPSDLQRRVWELERAVWQLQQKVFDLESKRSEPSGDTWVCTVTAMGTPYTGTGGSKAVAKSNALEACKRARGGEGFFCHESGCEK